MIKTHSSSFRFYALCMGLLISFVPLCHADCPPGTMDLSDNSDEDECVALSYPAAKPGCPPGTVKAIGEPVEDACRHLYNGTIEAPFNAADGCPEGYTLGFSSSHVRTCTKPLPPAEPPQTSAEPACPRGTVPLIARNNQLECKRSHHLPLSKFFEVDDTCPTGTRPGADSLGRRVCKQR